ncbi:MAG: hypothetical protein JO190_07455 [Candidatus Eremiobacteraeota bacterium]|nr:hypothetical protein [Candidatus Eremiobacteraeota bacterium]MBV8497781.1 hypothetical protein [Candidatus Eremiobacteraeota bacterium]
MQTKFYSFGTAISAVLLLAVSACAGGSNPTVPATGLTSKAPVGIKHFSSIQQLAVSSCQPCATFKSGPSSEYYFSTTRPKVRRHIVNGIAAPWVGLTFDPSGDLFVANCMTCVTGQSGTNNVVEIPPHNNTPSVTITNGITYPFDLAIDSSGTLYVSNLGCYSPSCESTVAEYPQGYTTGPPSNAITVKYPLGLALDSSQDLYVANCVVCSTGTTGSDQVLVYAPGGTTPIRTITTGVNEPVALAVDSSNNLYVANCINCGLGAGAYVNGTDTITEYASGSTTPVKTITFTNAVDVPFSIAVDPSGDLFVANYAVNTVTEYPPNAVNPSETISHGVSSPASLAIDRDNNVFVSNAGANTVTKYAPRHPGRPQETLSVAFPSSLAVSH